MTMASRLFPLGLILLSITLLYAKVSTAYFCGYDDFFELHRAAIEDTKTPRHIFSTTHFNTPKYRPLSRALGYLTYYSGPGSALPFRLRNLAFHLLGVSCVYGIALTLFRRRRVAIVSALLFGLHPLANQSVVAASWTNTTAYSFALLWFFLFVYSFHSERRKLLWLSLSFVAALISLFFYESCIVMFGLIYGYLAVESIRKRSLVVESRQYTGALLGGTAIVCIVFFVLRSLVVTAKSPVVPLGAIVKNFAIYAAALFMPVDLVFLNSVFGTPLAVGLLKDRMALAVLMGGTGLAIVILGGLIVSLPSWRERLRSLDWLSIAFFLGAIPVSISTFLVFTDHASETYLYLATALLALALGVALDGCFRSTRVFVTVAGVIALLFSAATWVRNERVASCGATAARIFASLPLEQWKQGNWNVRFAYAPGETYPTRYGIYGYAGLSTIDPGDLGMRVMQNALQLVTLNPAIEAEVVWPKAPLTNCTTTTPCFWVHKDGRVESGPAPEAIANDAAGATALHRQ
jgi:hypothetical protein